MKTINLFFASFILLLIVSCTKVITVDVPSSGTKLVVVDAFISNSSDTQKVRLTTTADYFSNTATPPLLGATITLNDLTNAITYTFTPDGKGNYYYVPLANDSMAQITHKYQLNISANGNTYMALSTLNQTTVVDTIAFRSTGRDFSNQYPNDTTTPKRRFYPAFIAKDIAGADNYYWVKVYNNGIFYNQPKQMDFFQDAGYQGTDGDIFLPPVCFFQLTSDDNPIHRYDVCTIKILSINKDTYSFLNQLQTQLTNSQSGLFAVTPQNVKTNIQQTVGTQKAIGWFNMGAISAKSQVAK